MTDKEFRRLRRPQLIEIVYELQAEQKKLIDEKEALQKQFEQEKETLLHQFEQEKAELSQKLAMIENAGSIAEAAAALSGIFEKAQKTADEYIAAVYSANQMSYEQSESIINEARKEADQMLKEAELILENAKAESAAIRQETEADIENRWDGFQKKVNAVLQAHKELAGFFNSDEKDKAGE